MGINYVNCLAADGDSLWCGTKDGLVSPSIAFCENYVRPPFNGLNNQTILSLEVRAGQKFPLCGTTRGLYTHDSSDWRKEMALGDREIRCLLRIKDILWCGTNRGLFCQTNGQWRLIESDLDFPSSTFNCLSLIDDQLWCGTEDGLTTFNGSHFSQKLLGMNILCLQQDLHGAIWCGTAFGLLYLPHQGSWSCSLEVRDRVECLRIDSKNILWCGARKGLWKISEQYCQRLPEMNQDISCLLEWQGQLWCGGIDGIKSLDIGTSLPLGFQSVETQQTKFDSQLRKLQEYVDASRLDFQKIYEDKLSEQDVRIKNLERQVADLQRRLKVLDEKEEPQILRVPSLVAQDTNLTSEEGRAQLIQLRDLVIKREFPDTDPARGVLRKTMLEAILKSRPVTREAWERDIPQDLREKIEPDQLQYVDSIIQIVSRMENKSHNTQPNPQREIPNTDAKTQERIDFFNQLLRQSLPDIKKGLSQNMSAMAIDFEAYQAGEVYLYENKTGIFYAVANLNKRYEAYYDPGFPVTQAQIKSVYDVSGVGNFVKRLVEPAIFYGDSAQKKIKLIQKGKLIA